LILKFSSNIFFLLTADCWPDRW